LICNSTFEGANSGIGYATAKVFASTSPNYHVIVAGRNIDACKTAAEEIKANGVKGSLSALQLDVNSQQSVDAAAQQVEEEFGRLDVLINNAGITDTTLPKDLDFKQRLDQVLTTNVTGPAIVSRAFQPLLFKSKNAYSIYVSSGLASLGHAADPNHQRYHSGYTVYRLSKTALNMWALQESKELKDKGVKVHIMCPGLVRSNLRGKTEDMVSAGGNASDPAVSGQTLLSIVEGKRDQDIGKFLHKDGLYDW
jgi:NAD(P)-dependent dehydrogenase (short-subunit alcohol dehydrogenase family)